MYLEYQDYVNMGGTLDSTAFSRYERKAEYAINAQAAGMTGKRLAQLDKIPQAIADCVFELVSLNANNTSDSKTVTSESQSSGGVSESYSYDILSNEQIQAETEDIIYNAFFGAGLGKLLYRGLWEDD